jgi:hypothetical protein
MKEHVDGYMTGNILTILGTDFKQLGDIWADLLMWIPKDTPVGMVAYGPYVQAKEIYKQNKDQIMKCSGLVITSHSLGSGIACIIALLARLDGYAMEINIMAKGGLKTIDRNVRAFLQMTGVVVDWRVRHRDPIPHIPLWVAPYHKTEKEGDKRRWPLDYDFNLDGEHCKY